MDYARSIPALQLQLRNMQFALKLRTKESRLAMSSNELFELMHKNKKDMAFVDEKSASINAAFKAKKLVLSQMSNESAFPDDDAIFIEMVGGMNKKGYIYGLGSQSSSFHANSTSCRLRRTLGDPLGKQSNRGWVGMKEHFPRSRTCWQA